MLLFHLIKKIHWSFKVIFVAGIFVANNIWSYLEWDRDISHGRLGSKGFDVAPVKFNFWQVSAPVLLLVLTKCRIPVSTSFMLLSL